MRDMISIVIPVFNEENRIYSTLERIVQYVKQEWKYFEIIIVNDGSTDKTNSVLQEISNNFKNIRIISFNENRGKGFAISKGVISANGDFILTTDADLSCPIEELKKLFLFLHKGFDIVISSRALEDSNIIVSQPYYRKCMGKIFNMLVRFLVINKFKDTQCGFKLFKKEAAKTVFGASRINGFCYDVETLFLASKMKFRVIEVPVQWLNSPSSRVRLFKDPLRMFFDLLKIRIYWFAGTYKLANYE
jgi:dolichyl-phosphate beta-glucosyltransferase